MDEKYYAFLMQKIVIDGDLYLYKPISLIEGTLENYYESENDESFQWFVAQDGNSYCFADDFYGSESESEYVCYYIMSEEKLLKNYPSDSLMESKTLLSTEVFDTLCYGVCDFANSKIKIFKQSIVQMVARLLGSEKINDDFVNDNEDLSVEISFGMDFLDQLLSLKTYDEIISTLERIKKGGEETLKEAKNNSKKVTPDYIKKLFEAIYETLLDAKDIDEMKELLSHIEDSYIALTYSLDNVSSKNQNKVEDELLNIADSYSKLQKIDSLKEIKDKLLEIKKEAKIRNDELASMYENNEIKEIISIPRELVSNKEETKENPPIIDIKEMKKAFDDKIINQEEAKRDVISAIYMNKLLDDPRNKNNCLLVGPTGSGKTLIAEAVAEYLDMPIEIIDTTQLTMPGYVGANLEDFLERLLENAKGDLEKAENGIVVFDEIDKKGSNDNSDVSGKGVLNTLLPFIGGTKYNIVYHGRHMQFDTSKLTIFATGAFTEINNDDIYNGSKIGFENKEYNDVKKEDIKYRQFETEDFIKKGKMPAELIGRFSVITQLSGHTIESLKEILLKSNVSALLSEKAKLEKVNINLSWTDEYLDAVAKRAIKLKTGARSLKSTVDKSVKEVRWEVLNNLDIYKEIILTEKSVLDNKDVILVDINDEKHNLRDILAAKEKTSIKIYKKSI